MLLGALTEPMMIDDDFGFLGAPMCNKLHDYNCSLQIDQAFSNHFSQSLALVDEDRRSL